MKQVKKLDFAGDEIYCGIDVHKKSWKVCIRNKYFEFKTFLQPPSVNILVNYLRKNFPEGNYFALYEAGFCGFSYQREFVQHGVKCMVVHAADIPTTDKEKRSKSDTIDCRKLSQRLSEGSLKPIHIPCLRQQNDRHLLKDQTVLTNRIKCWLFFKV
jgi:transposase